MRRLWPSRLVTRLALSHRQTRLSLQGPSPRFWHGSTSYQARSARPVPRNAENATDRLERVEEKVEDERLDEDSSEEEIVGALGPPPSPTAFAERILSVTPPQSPVQGAQYLKPLQDALLSAFLPANQHVHPVASCSTDRSSDSGLMQVGLPFHQITGGALVPPSASRDTELLQESVIAVTSPFEGGSYYNFESVKLTAATLDADLLKFDLVLGVGLNGTETAYNDVPLAPKLPRRLNPPMQDVAGLDARVTKHEAPAPARAAENEETEETQDAEDSMDESGDFQASGRTILVTSLVPQQFGGRDPYPRTTRPLDSEKVEWVRFFLEILRAQRSRRPRIVYLEGSTSMGPSFPVWWTSFIKAVRLYRADKGEKEALGNCEAKRKLVIVLSFSPSLLPHHSATSRSQPVSQASMPPKHIPEPLQSLALHLSGERDPDDAVPLWWGGIENDTNGREQRIRERLSSFVKGNDQCVIPFLSISTGEQGGLNLPLPFMEMLSPQSQAENLFDRIIWRSIPIVPAKRQRQHEQVERLTSRLAISAALVQNALAPFDGSLGDIESCLREVGSHTMYRDAGDRGKPLYTLGQERRASKAFDLIEDSHLHWQNAVITSQKARIIASVALSNRIRASRSLVVPWSDIIVASNEVSTMSQTLRRHVAGLTKKIKPQSRAQPQPPPARSVDSSASLIASVKISKDLDTYEKRLLRCIVDPSKISSGTFDKVHLPVETIDTIRTMITLPLLYPDAFARGVLKHHASNGALLFGPPGTGKTLMARAVANESGARMIAIQAGDVNDKYVGESEKLIRGIFSLARRLAPCIIFFDEVDSLFGARSGDSSGRHHHQVLTEFMQEMDGLGTAEVNKKKGVMVIGATNRPFDLDEAVLRRLPRRLLIDLPDVKSRRAILDIMLQDEAVADDVQLDAIAQDTEGFSGSDLKHLCVSAAMAAVKETVKVPWKTKDVVAISDGTVQQDSDTHLKRVLCRRHFDSALKQIRPSASEEGTFTALRKWAERFGDGGSGRGRKTGFGNGFGFSDPASKSRRDTGYGRITQV